MPMLMPPLRITTQKGRRLELVLRERRITKKLSDKQILRSRMPLRTHHSGYRFKMGVRGSVWSEGLQKVIRYPEQGFVRVCVERRTYRIGAAFLMLHFRKQILRSHMPLLTTTQETDSKGCDAPERTIPTSLSASRDSPRGRYGETYRPAGRQQCHTSHTIFSDRVLVSRDCN
jgi:hypothetical protein